MTDDPAAVLEADYETIRVDRDGEGTATVTIDRPDARNALNGTVRAELTEVLEAVEDSDARVGVITGSEDCNAFVAGADVSEFRDRGMLEQRDASERPRIYETVADLQTPMVARINGHALGGGLELATACDIRIAQRGAKLGQPEINLGIIPGGGGTQRLPRLIGEGQAMKLILTGDLIDVDEAHDIGLVDEVSDPEGFDDCVSDVVTSIAEKSPVALRYAKESVRAASRMNLDNGIEYEAELFAQLFATEDKDEGIDAFFEDREPEWKGE
ncbi:enoyl-CoA hydratase/isomerase family protein [Halomicroarcula limicola]|uniref:Enoyl-CoA hydratase/isomerase family protein n=1 Tax=Haloarcula limicola TaxID=1429915 RepID=A0A8J7YCK9_9EURY|nr:enoyl-CoA hydratase-related protein [Halomicroarcula limicola]MBV0925983.1 enoyl-CoA hydratase/isomerase family protein [Halomicroarcula limicola]